MSTVKKNWQFYKHATIIFLIGIAGGVAVAMGKLWLFSAAVFLAVIFIIFPHKKSTYSKWRTLNSSETLFESSAFIATISVFSFLSFLYLTLDLTTAPSINLHEKAFEKLSKPILIFGLSLPVIALIANHHRSIQTSRQLENSQKGLRSSEGQNIFTNFIKHKELFSEVFAKKAFLDTSLASVEPNLLYSLMYSGAIEGNLKTSDDYNYKIKELRKLTELFFCEIKNIQKGWELNKEEIAGKLLKIKTYINRDLNVLILNPNINFELKDECISFTGKLLNVLDSLYSCANFALQSDSNQDMLMTMRYVVEIRKNIELK